MIIKYLNIKYLNKVLRTSILFLVVFEDGDIVFQNRFPFDSTSQVLKSKYLFEYYSNSHFFSLCK